MSKARELAELGAAYDSGALSNRNVIINGNFDVWQRGTSQTTSGYGSADRWRVVSDGTISASKVEDTVNGKKVATLSSTVSGQTYHVIQQRLEHLRRYQGQTMTLSGWVKGSVGTFGQYIEFRDSGGSGVSSVTFNLTFTGSWQYVTYTFTVPTNAAFDNDSSWFNVSFYGGASLALSQIQLEVGPQATPFEFRNVAQEIMLCSRYFSKESLDLVPASYYSYRAHTAGHTYRTPMRATPTVTVVSAQTGASSYVSGYSTGTNNLVTSINYNVGAIQTSGDAWWTGAIGGVNYVNCSAAISSLEPQVGIFTFDAEL